jgi:pilus assembly protein CpaB
MNLALKAPQVNRNIVTLAVAIVAGLATCGLVVKYLHDQRTQIEAETVGKHRMLAVMVAKENLPRGTVVQPGEFEPRPMPLEYIHASAIDQKHLGRFVGQKLAAPLRKGEALLIVHLESTAQVFSNTLKNGNRALTTEVDEVNSISGLLRPTDHIDLMVTARGIGKKTGDVTFPLLTNVEVLATGQVTRKTEGANGKSTKTYTTITLSVSPEDAERIVVAKNSGKLTAVLRNPQDDKSNSVSAMNIDDVLPRDKKKHGGGYQYAVEYIIGGR